MNERQLKEKIYQLEIELKSLKFVLETQNNAILGRPTGTTKYSEEEINFLKLNKNMKMPNLVEAFNKKFNKNFPKKSRGIYNFMVRNGIIEQKFARYIYQKQEVKE